MSRFAIKTPFLIVVLCLIVALVGTLVRECGDYMRLTLKSAQMIEAEKSQLHDRAVHERSALADTKLEVSLIARHAMAGCRKVIETALSKEEAAVRNEKPPRAADVKIGRVFDHNWELLSPLLPMGLLRRAVLRRFQRKVGDEVFKNLSRLTSQWEEIVNGAIAQLQREAENRIEDLVSTLDRLTSMPASEASRIRDDLGRLEAIAREVGVAQESR
jgi:hypothetical protein